MVQADTAVYKVETGSLAHEAETVGAMVWEVAGEEVVGMAAGEMARPGETRETREAEKVGIEGHM